MYIHLYRFIIYITVCCYLNLLVLQELKFCPLDLHYSMLLFKPKAIKVFGQKAGHLHYSMLLFKHKERKNFDKVLYIYITVCCYLNKYSQIHWLVRKSIYITVCCYLNFRNWQCDNFKSKIYITVCCYLNGVRNATVCDKIKFTLQYVAI